MLSYDEVLEMLLGGLTLRWHHGCCFARVSPSIPQSVVPWPGPRCGAEYPVASSVLSLCADPAQDTRWLLPGGGQPWVFFDLAFTFGFQTLPVHCLGLKPGRNFQNPESYLNWNCCHLWNKSALWLLNEIDILSQFAIQSNSKSKNLKL